MNILIRPLPKGHCLLCRAPATQAGICGDCLNDLEDLKLSGLHTCACCNLPLTQTAALCGECLRHPPAFSTSCIPLAYAYPLDQLIGSFKYSACNVSAQILTHLFCGSIQATYQETCLPVPELVIPVPLHWRRQLQRGFNQSEGLARAAANCLNSKLATHCLRRTRATHSQQGLSRRERQVNLRGAFCVPARYREQIRGRTIALVDDVMTTSTTAREVSHVLVRAGARDIHLWALARTPEHD